MFNRFFGGGSANNSQETTQPSNPASAAASSSSQVPSNAPHHNPPFTLLVIQQDAYHWKDIIDELGRKLGQQAAAAAQAASPPTSASSSPANETIPSEQQRTAAIMRFLKRLKVVQTSWEDIDVGPCDNYSTDLRKRCVVSVRKQWINGREVNNGPDGTFRMLTVFPDFVLIRNEVTTPERCHRAKLLGFLYSNVPSMNSLLSILLMADRPVMHAMLNQLSVRMNAQQAQQAHQLTQGAASAAAAAGAEDAAPPRPPTATANADAMPLIPQCFFPQTNGFFYGHSFPAVVKFGSAHAGVGKILVKDHHQMEDIRSLLVCTKEGHCLAEPFVEGEYDLRLQKIGRSIRVMKRQTCTGAWKTQTQTCVLENLDAFPAKYSAWLSAAAQLFGAEHELDICTLDVIVEEKTGKEYILELNGTSSGWGHNAEEDNLILAQLLVERMMAAEAKREAGTGTQL